MVRIIEKRIRNPRTICHYQAVKEVASGFEVMAVAEDGLVILLNMSGHHEEYK